MSIDKLAGIYVFCMDYHGGQNCRLYRLLSKLSLRLDLRDSAIYSIQNYQSLVSENQYDEWWQAREVYQHLKEKYESTRRQKLFDSAV